MKMPTDMPKAQIPKEHGAKAKASEAVDEMLSEAEKIRHRSDVEARRRRTLEELEEDARTLSQYARGKMEHMGEVLRETAEAAGESTGLSGGKRSVPSAVESTADSMKDTLQAASDKLSAELGDLGEAVASVKARVAESMQAAGGRAAETWHQSSEAAKNVGEREYCMPVPRRICARHVAFVGLPFVVLFLLLLLRRRYPKKWSAGVKKMQQPCTMLARETPSREKMQAKASNAKDLVEEKTAYAKRQAAGVAGEARDKYENKKEK
ncbi:hypothetical protein BBJ28_00013260 [Nothophytophthora sp. Chile5]|nr:hypothetical protein BBJ28_00013260 [Nothophytophthora sp. Chile5]